MRDILRINITLHKSFCHVTHLLYSVINFLDIEKYSRYMETEIKILHLPKS